VSGFVDWGLARQVADRLAGESPAAMPGLDLAAVSGGATDAVLSYTGLVPNEPIPAAEWVSRREWAAMNLQSMRELVGQIEDRLGSSLPEPGHETFAAIAGRLIGAEVGLMVGLLSRRVLGQYEFSMAGVERPTRLVFVGPSIEAAAEKLSGKPSDVLEWVALHEGTHAAHFAAAPWLRGYVGGLTNELLDGTSIQASPGELMSRARGAVTSDPRRILAGLRESDPMSLLASDASRATIAEVQAAMAAIEGYAEHVMDAAAGDLGDAVAAMRAATERRRYERNPLARLISWLLGFEMKVRQYRDGKRFADSVVEVGGIELLNRAWSAPEALPALDEVAAPDRWIERLGTQTPIA